MKRIVLASTAIAAVLGAALFISSPSEARGPGMGYGPGWGAQGVAAGPAAGCPRWGNGPGTQAGRGYGPGMGMGWQGGRGYGPGMAMGMGRHGGRGYGPGMSRQGGRGFGGPGKGMGWGGGRGFGGYGPDAAATADITVDTVKSAMEARLKWRGNENVKVGEVAEKDENTIVAEIVTKDGSLVQRFEIDKKTGWRRFAK